MTDKLPPFAEFYQSRTGHAVNEPQPGRQVQDFVLQFSELLAEYNDLVLTNLRKELLDVTKPSGYIAKFPKRT